MSKWRFLRRATQLVTLIAFIWLFRRTEFDGVRPTPDAVNWLFRLDPLAAASAMLAGRAVLTLFWPAAITLALTLVLGRVFCGWVCPLGTILDGFHRLVGRRRSVSPAAERQRVPGRWQWGKYALLAAVLGAAAGGVPIVGYFDPFAVLVRAMTFAVDPLLNSAARGPFEWLYRHGGEGVTRISEPVYEFLRNHALPLNGAVYLLPGVSLALLALLLLAELFQRRFWCRNLCPLGGMLALFARVPLLRRRPPRACGTCLECASDCRMDAFDGQHRLVPPHCNLCMDCAADCPRGIVKFTIGETAGGRAAPDIGRRRILGAALGGAAVAVVSGLEGTAGAAVRRRCVRPPGAAEEDRFLDLCVRCGLCMKACPTNALQPALWEAGWGGLFSPRLVPRIGYCEYNCTLCGQVCPSGALRRLTEEEKHGTVLGLAEFDKGRCLPYAKGEACIVCEEHCPTPVKAIRVREAEIVNERGEKVSLKIPYVDPKLCVGCGICENKCPLGGEAGIRVRHLRDAGVASESSE